MQSTVRMPVLFRRGERRLFLVCCVDLALIPAAKSFPGEQVCQDRAAAPCKNWQFSCRLDKNGISCFTSRRRLDDHLLTTRRTMNIEYKINTPVSTDQFIKLLRESSLGERRPIEDRECMEGMVKNSNLMVTAWIGEKLIGIARSMTDFHYACYLSDLAVDKEHQKHGIGKELQIITQKQLGPKCKLILVAAPAANLYYEHIGFTNNQRCWVLERGQRIRS